MSWNHVSPSQIENFIKCKRSWFFKSIQKIQEPQKGHQSLGEAFHLIMEKVPAGQPWPSRTDVSASSEDWDKADQMAKLALPLMPQDPNGRFKREQGIRLATYANGPTMVGYIDLGIPAGIGWPAFMFPANEAIVADYKTLSDFRYMRTPQELADSVQMMTYAKWAIEPYPLGLHGEGDPVPDHVRLVHMYARTKPPFKAGSIRYESAIVTPDEINNRWEKTLDIVREMQQVSSCGDAEDVLANGALTGHCEAYGGCHFRDKCGIAPSTGIKSIFQIGKKPTTQETEMSGSPILDKIKAARAAQGLQNPTATPAATSPATPVLGATAAPDNAQVQTASPVTGVAGSASPGTTANPATSPSTVKVEPSGNEASVANPGNQPASTNITPKGPVSGLLAKIQSKGKGTPTLGGAIGQAFEKETGTKAAGQGELGKVTANTLNDLMKLASGIVPPEAPPRAQAVITKPGDTVVDPLKATEEGEEGEDDGEDSSTNVAPTPGQATTSTPIAGSTSTVVVTNNPVATGKRGRPSKEELAAREAAQKAAFDAAVDAEVAKRMRGAIAGPSDVEALVKELEDAQKACEAAHASNAKLLQANEKLMANIQGLEGQVSLVNPQASKEGLTLYVDCFPVKGDRESTDFFEWIGPICAAVAQQNSVGDWRQINYTGKGLLANAIRETIKGEGLPKAMTISTYAGGADIALEILTPLAKKVIKKV